VSDSHAMTSKKVNPNYTMTRNKELPVLAADFVLALSDVDEHVCTLTFVRRNPTIKYDIGNRPVLEGIEEEMFLEVKMPLEVAIGFGLYMQEILKEIKANPNKRNQHFFGPTAITQDRQ